MHRCTKCFFLWLRYGLQRHASDLTKASGTRKILHGPESVFFCYSECGIKVEVLVGPGQRMTTSPCLAPHSVACIERVLTCSKTAWFLALESFHFASSSHITQTQTSNPKAQHPLSSEPKPKSQYPQPF